MKLFKLNIFAFCMAALWTGCSSNDVEEHHFDNKLFVNVETPVEELVFKSGSEVVTETRELTMATALQATEAITGKFVANPSLTSTYNLIYNANAQPLPAEMCVIEEPEAKIKVGGTVSAPVTVTFTNLQQLDRNLVYVMPVELVDVQGIDVLASKTKTYFIFKGASLINVVADIAQNNLPVNWNTPDLVRSMKTVTVEALIRARDFGTSNGLKGEAMSTIFGIEGKFLLRIGDAGFPQNQVQMVNPNGNFPEGNSELGLPVDQWVHVAAVWDATTGDRIMYTNGQEVARDSRASGTVNLTSGSCYVGKAWNDDRWLDGEISELRVWSVQRTQEQIASSMYEVDPNTDGLVAYWKFDEGVGKQVKDHTANGNNITAVNDLTWTKVSLPEK